MKIKSLANCLVLSGTALLFLPFNSAFSAGFSTDLLSTSGIATSYAGSATGIHDISDSYQNPAAVSSLKGTSVILSGSYLKLDIDSKNTSGNHAFTSQRISGSQSGDAVKDPIIPAFYIATPIKEGLVAGLNVTVPYGLATKYDANWAGRYQAIDSEIMSYNINPFAAYEVNKSFSIGAGLQAQNLKMRVTNAVDIGGLPPVSMGSGSADYIYRFKGDDWGYGYTLGTKYKFSDQLQIGIGYRSKIVHTLEGNADLSPTTIAIPTVARSGVASKMKLTTPETIIGGISFKPNAKFEIAFDSTWMRYSRIKAMSISSSDPLMNPTSDFNWNNAWRNAIGLNYNFKENLILRAGAAYEKNAINTRNRNPRVPTGNRTWLSCGFGYSFNKNMTVDFAYLHEFDKKTRSNTDPIQSNSYTTLSSEYKTNADVVSLGIRYEM